MDVTITFLLKKMYNKNMDDDGYYYSKEDAIAAYLYTQARIKTLEKKALKRLTRPLQPTI